MKNIFKINALTTVLLVSLVFTSGCYYDQVVPPPEPEVPDEVSYSAHIQPFFDAKCISCHGPNNPSLEAPDSYDNIINGGYVNTTDPPSSTLYTVLDGFMGANVTSSEKEMVLKWITDGAQNN
jgi:hypothetical protein